MEQVLSGIHELDQLLVALLISLPRLHAFLTLSGVLSSSAVPRLARNGAILMLALPLVPLNLAYAPMVGENLPAFAAFFAKEYAIGFILGYLVNWIFWSVAATGDFIDNQRGAAIASSIDPLQGHETSPLGNLFSQAFMTYFYSVGGMLVMISVLYKSFVLWPVFNMLPIASEQFPVLMLQVLDLGMRTMFVLAGPVIALMFLSEFALALVSRFAPQVQVFILAMPIKSAVAIFILVFYIQILFPFASDQQSLFPALTDQFYAILEQGL